jgi:hypothetical protein
MDAPDDLGLPDTSLPPDHSGEPSLSSIRRILLARERERIDQLEEEKNHLEAEVAALQARLAALRDDMAAAEARLHGETAALAAEIDEVIARKAEAAPEELAEALGPVMAGAIRVQERRSREELIDAVGPVMGEAIEAQIRESRHSLIEALYPIIGELAGRYIGEFFRELQRNIDARLKSAIGPERVARRARARLRGVPAADLEMRDALPFAVREVFLIETGSGLLMARAGSEAAVDSDLISGMLTAVRSFMHDSFGQSEAPGPMDEVQYGEQRIIIQDGRLCYLAVVISGIEPPGFRAELRRFLTRLQSDQHQVLLAYDGDVSSMGEIAPVIERLAADLGGMAKVDEPKPLSRGQKAILALGGLGGLALIALACFYLQFTMALLPVAFPGPSPTPTITPSPTPTVTATATATPTSTAVPTATATPSPTITATSTATATSTPAPTATVQPFAVVTNRPVWAFSEPSLDSDRVASIPIDTSVIIVSSAGQWLLIEWPDANDVQQGWVFNRWVDFIGTPPPDLPVTPES